MITGKHKREYENLIYLSGEVSKLLLEILKDVEEECCGGIHCKEGTPKKLAQFFNNEIFWRFDTICRRN